MADNIGTIFEVLEDSVTGEGLPLHKVEPGDSVTGKHALAALAFKDSDGNFSYPQLSVQGAIPISSGYVETELTGSISPVSSNVNSSAMTVSSYRKGALQISWLSLNAFNATVILEASNDGSSWSELGGNLGGVTLDGETDSQLWWFEGFSAKYIRIAYKANNVSSGSISWVFKGYS